MTKDEAIQQALSAMLSCETGHPSDGNRQWYDENLIEPAIEALRAALAQPEPAINGWPLYSGLPQREWVGLTNKEFVEIYDIYTTVDSAMEAVEAKLKEKNSG